MDITDNFRLKKISASTNKKHWRVRAFTKKIQEEIGLLRLTAMKNKGTNLAVLCDRRANDLERRLSEALQ